MRWLDFKEWRAHLSWVKTMEPLALRKTYLLTDEEMEEFREQVNELMKKWKDEII